MLAGMWILEVDEDEEEEDDEEEEEKKKRKRRDKKDDESENKNDEEGIIKLRNPIADRDSTTDYELTSM